MALERAGLVLTAEEASKFIADLAKGESAMKSFGQQAQQVSQQVSGTTVTFGDIQTQMASLSKEGFAAVTARANELIDSTKNLDSAAGRGLTTNEAYAQALKEVAASSTEAGDSARKAAKGTDAAGKAAEEATASYIAFGAALAIVSAKAVELVLKTTLTASRIKELGILLEVTRQNAISVAQSQGEMSRAAVLTSSAVEGQVQSIRDLHLSGIVANKTVATLIRYNLDWTRSTELARLAQDAATFAMQDSSQALDGLIRGITTLQPRVLRTYGIMVNLNEAYRIFAEENDLVVKDLTRMQRQQAALNEVLAQAPTIAGAYEASLSSATKQIRSMQTDIINLAEAYGQFLEPALAGAAKGAREFIQILTELPAPVRAAVSGLAAGGTATVALTSASSTALLVLLKLREALTALSGAALTASTALLGVGGAVTVGLSAILALTAYVEEQKRAQDELEASILSSTDSYDAYIQRMEDAGLAANILAENIWKVVKAKEAEQQIDEAREYIEALNALEELMQTLEQLPAGADFLSIIAEGLEQIAADDKLAQIFAEDEEALQRLIDDMGVFGGVAANEAQTVVAAWTLVAEALQVGATLQDQEAALAFIEDLGTRMDLTGEDGVRLAIILDAVAAAIQNMGPAFTSTYDDMIERTEALNEAFGRQLTLEFYRKRFRNHQDFMKAIAEATDKGVDAITDAWTKRNRSLEDLDTKYENKATDAWRKFQDDLVDIHEKALKKLAEADLEYLQDRSDAWADYQQDLADAERELQQDIEDANRDRARDLADLDREYAQDRKDALSDLNEDLADMEKDLAKELEEIRRDHLQDMLDLEQEFADKRRDIEEDYAQQAQDIEEKYQTEPDYEDTIDARRKALLEELQAIRDAHPEYVNSISQREKEILEELEKLKQEELAALEKAKQEELAALEEALEAERAAREEALQKELEEAQTAYEERRAERQRQYAEELADLAEKNRRERAEIDRRHQEKLSDLRLQHQRERAEIDANYQQRLADIDTQYAREKLLIQQKLDEQNAAAREKYDDALRDISIAKVRERDEINKQYARTKQDILDAYDATVRESAEKFGQLPAAFQPTYDELERQAREEMAAVKDAILDELDALMRELEMGSPSRLMMKIGESMVEGLAVGLDSSNAADLIGDAFSADAFQANINAALPAQRASLPMGMGGRSVTNAQTSNLTVNAQYQQHQSEASLRDDLSLWNGMMRAWGR